MHKVIARARLLFISLFVLLVLSASIPVYDYVSSGKASNMFTNFANGLKGVLKSFSVSVSSGPGSSRSSTSTNITITNNDSNSNSKTDVKVTSSPTPKPVTKTCYKHKVIHLDGSSSNLCFSKEDYGLLVNLWVSYSSAKTFYEFHLDGVEKYQSEYERTGSSIYLDAKASSQASADREKLKMDKLVGQMQEIEKRGY